jgi:hypothetical protein
MRPRLHDMTAQQIHAEFVADAINGILTPIERMVEGCKRISYLRRISVDDAFKEIRDEARHKGAVGVFL